ncbi:dynamin family protein [Aspergillus chevalieri]|uniref:Uncharacterized protein n=1 Tax=Aspergillus chevalieri TaxID=182096 RepID=A0A7R7VVA8_ASPCH|nr:uncharacterized protein ACHE_70296S [Aspergillus chevalieri]BCR91453.1 hypothetical protein ACHE_70296S [Aspergillus chevalieri]
MHDVTKPSLDLSGANELDNDDRVRVLAIIDQLRELGINEDISLPQLVVVGDQSSGKSSLLEGLTGLSFPVASELCTRFATQIVLRRAPASEAAVSVSIIPGPAANADEATKKKLLEFERTMEAKDFGAAQFSAILDEAAECMGLPSTQTAGFVELDKRFSDDILKIELSDPEHSHLSVVDVPGLFHNPTKFQTIEDRNVIRGLIQRYIIDKRTIIMAVMDARNNLANQEVFHMARAADPDGLRTVGIITKCDALQAGDEHGVLEIFRNEMVRLSHGWFAVRNRSTKEIKEGVTMAQRHINEKQFFNTAPWANLRKDRVGIGPLKSFLGQVLFDHIRNEFPGLVNEVRNLTNETKKDLESLGPSRQTSADQRRYLIRSAVDYQRDVSNILSGIYSPRIESGSPRKLRTRLRFLMDEFSSRMAKEGHRWAFKLVDGRTDPEYAKDANKADEESYKEVDLQSHGNSDNANDIEEWIRSSYNESRGVELPGTVNPHLLENLFREQCASWGDIAIDYLSKIVNAVSAYDGSALKDFVTDSSVRQKLQTRLKAKRQTAEEDMFAELRNILADELSGTLQTANPSYSDMLSTIRNERVQARVASMGIKDADSNNFDQFMTNEHWYNEQQAVNDIHDILVAYYKVARQRFVDNVIIQAGERYVVGETGPLKIFSPEYISGFSNEELSDIAGENYSTSVARSEITSRGERLQRALEIARRAGI